MSSESSPLQESVDQNHQKNEGNGKKSSGNCELKQDDNSIEEIEKENSNSNVEENEEEVKVDKESSTFGENESRTGSDWFDDEIDNDHEREDFDDEENNNLQLVRILRQIARIRELFDSDSDEDDDDSDSDESFYDGSDDNQDEDDQFISDSAELEQFMNEQGMHPWDDEEREIALTFLANQEDY